MHFSEEIDRQNREPTPEPPATPDSPVARFLEKGGGLHHLCYEVDDLQAQIQWMKSQPRRDRPLTETGRCLGGRHIAWMRTSDSLLIEYLERHLSGSSQEASRPVSQEDSVVVGQVELKR